MAQVQYYPSFFKALFNEKHNIASAGGDTLKARLITSAFDSTDDTWSDISADELSTAGGYTAGGVTLTVTYADVVDGVFRVIITSPEWTGSGSGFTFRTLVIVNDSAPSDELICAFDFGRNVTIASGESTKTLLYTAWNEVDGIIVLAA